ncbi:hypothetical protein [Halalkalibacterium ligniniphilum]|uniref:hypothetical protein n=1 Tax=Halalkalibacterium ligniniphilum TaxID=1134413 RepID=UPI00034AD332|nr:hypothetical protein [Halalkalibacterium ligniniphilum]
MRDAYDGIEFHDLSINITKQSLYQFIKKMMHEAYSLYWRYDEKFIFLMLEKDQTVQEIPFVKNRSFLTLKADTLLITERPLAQAIERLLQWEKGTGIVKRLTKGPQYITSYQAGDIESTFEIDGSEKLMNGNSSMIQYKDNGKSLEPRIIFNIMNLEIDYVLMELHEAIVNGDEEQANLHKKKLKKLLSRREQVEQLL